MNVPDALRDDLLRYLLATSGDKARIIAELSARNPEMVGLLIDLEADDDLRARFEIKLMSGG